MRSGYVIRSDFSDRLFGEFMEECVGVDIHASPYTANGTSKANKLRTFWKLESDAQVGRCIDSLLNEWERRFPTPTDEQRTLLDDCRAVASRLLAGTAHLDVLKSTAEKLDAVHLAEQVQRMEKAVATDPALAVGTAKELVETVCRTILAERGAEDPGALDVPQLVKVTLRELKLVPDGVPESAKGAATIKRILSNLATIPQGLAELRNLYGTGHGREGRARGVRPRHAKLAVAAAAALATFLFETHVELSE